MCTFGTCSFNKSLPHFLQLILNSMHKYQPRIHIVKTKADKTFSVQQKIGDRFSTHIFPETQFMAVTAYQNQQVLKCNNNALPCMNCIAMHTLTL